MHNIDIKVQIFNPNVKTMMSIPQFDSLPEAIKMMGKKHILDIINKHTIFTSRIAWNKRIIDELQKR